MRFRFPLQSLLRYRENLEEHERALLEQFTREASILREQLATIECSRLLQLRHDAETLEVHGLRGSEMQFAAECHINSSLRHVRLTKELEEVERKRFDQQGRYAAARQQREVLDSLRDTQKQVFDREVLRHDQNASDDLFLIRRTMDKLA
ncbi:MAG TPA: hypothetical protein VN622_12490 [Clostridia bacterium]|nr:hypothetical protein [Clostridia bacterium]